MDLTRPVGYRGFPLNTLSYEAETHNLKGCQITSVQYGQVLGMGYDEKRALDEGRDASDVFLDQRLISLSGVLYGASKAEAHDLYRQFSEVMSPSAAYRDDPSHRGYTALDFWVPTDERYGPNHPQAGEPIWDNPAHPGLIHKVMFVRPLATPSARFTADIHGGADNDALAIPWNAQVAAKDPRIVNAEAKIVDLSGKGKDPGGTIRNSGNVPAVLEVTLIIPPNISPDTTPASFRLIIDGVNTLLFTLPRSSKTGILRYSSDQKVAAYKNPAFSKGASYALAMDRMAIEPATDPLRHISPGEHTWSWDLIHNVVGTFLNESSRFEFRDTWI